MTTNIQSFAGDVQIDSGNLSVKSLEVKDGVTKLGSNNTTYSNVGVMMTRKDGASNVAFLFTEDGANVVLGYTNDDALEGDRIDILSDEKANLVVYGNVYVSGSVHGDGSTLTGLVTTLQSVSEFGSETDQTILFTNEITGINVSSNVLVSGNVTANVYYGDGGLLSNITQTLEGITAIGNTTTYTLEFNNTHTSFVTVSNVGIGNALPTADLCVGSNVVIDDERLNKIAVTGNVACHQLNLGSIEILPAYSLENVTQIANTTTNTISFNHSTLAFDTQKMAGIGIIPSSADVGVSGLHVDGHLRLGGQADNTDNELMYIKSAGALGVLANESDTNNTNTDLRLQSGETYNSNITMVGKSSAQYMTFGTNTAERMRIDSSGNVGIGTTNPGYTLDVRGSANVASLNITDTTHSTSTTTGALKVAGGLGVASNIHTSNLFASDYVGIGTTNPTAHLELHSSALDKTHIRVYADGPAVTEDRIFELTDVNGSGLLQMGDRFNNNSTTYKIQLNTEGNSFFNGGNVGIGTTDPSSKLHVNGSIKCNSFTLSQKSGEQGEFIVERKDNGYTQGTLPLAHTTPFGWSTSIADANYTTATSNVSFTIDDNNTGSRWMLKFLHRDADTNLKVRVNAGTVHVVDYNDTPEDPREDDDQSWTTIDITDDVNYAGVTNTIYFWHNSTDAGMIYAVYVFPMSGPALPNEPVETDLHLYNGLLVNGNVGIGTTNPSSNLHVNGDVYVSSNLEVGTANLFVDTQTGNVGIGTVSPQGLLHISSGTSGDAHLILEADTDNNNESDNPKIVFRQDGGYYTGEIGLTDNRMVFRSKSTTTGNTGFIFYSNVAPGQTSKTDLDDLEDTQVEVMRIDGDGNVGIGTTNPTSNLHVVGNALITGLTYAIKSTGTLGSDKTEDWYRLLVGNNRGGSNAIRTKCKLQLVAAGLHQVLTFDFNHMINLSETSGNSFNLLGNDHYISRVGIIKLRLADIGSNQVALDMYIDHNVVDVNRVWTVTLYTEGGSLISEASTFLEKITTTPTTSIELSTDTSIFGIVGNTTGKHVVVSEDGNVGIGTTNPVGVNGGRRLEGSSSTGFEYIATRDDTSGVTGDFVGAYLFKNPDTDGSPPHYAGMSAKISGTNGPMDLRFYTNRDKYEDDDPKMIIESSGDVGIGTDNPAYTLDVNGTSNAATYYQNGVELYAQRRWEVDLTGQSSANFYPVELKHPTYEGSPDLPDMFPVHFKVFGESLAGADSYNENTLVGYARGGGYSDHDEMYDVHYRRYSGGINEKRFEGLYQGTTNYAEGIVIYMRGGYRYSVLTDATEVNTYTSATTLGEAVFAIKDVDGDDVSGTSANISRLVHLAGNEGERRFMSGILNITYSTASTSKTTGALTVSGGLGVASNIHTSNLFASNFVGIGVTSPETALHVLSSDSSTSNQTLKLENPYVFAFNAGRDIGSSIVFKNRWQGDGINDPIDMVTIEGRKEQNANYGDSYISFKTRYETDRGNGGAGTLTEKMRITGNGNVGIGTTNPAKRLTVSGDMEIGIQSADYRHLRIGGGNSSGFLYGCFAKYGDGIHMGYNFYNDNTNNQIPNNSGGTSRITMKYGEILLHTGGTNSEPNNDALTINSSGNIGIGTYSAPTPLALYRSIGNAGPSGTFNGTITETEYMRFIGAGLTTEVNSVSIGFKIAGDYLVDAQYSGRLNIYANDGPDGGNDYGSIPNRRIASIGAESAYFAEGESLRHRTRELSTMRKDWMQHEWGQPGTTADAATSFYYSTTPSNVGSTDHRDIRTSSDPYGRSCSVWRNTGVDNNGACGGWDVKFPINANRSYMSVVYVRRTGSTTGGSFYHGCDGEYTKNLTGTDNTNPYFTGGYSVGALPQDVWCVSISFIHYYGATSSDATGIAGIYRLDTMQKIKANSEFAHRYEYSSTTERYQRHRTFLFYNPNTGVKLDFWNPGFFEHQTTFPETSLLKMLTNDLVATNGYFHDKLGIGVTGPSYNLHVANHAKIGNMTTLSGAGSVVDLVSTNIDTSISLIGGSGGGTIVLYISVNTSGGDATGSAIVHFRMIHSGTWTDSATRKNVISNLNMTLPTFSDDGSGYLRMTTSVGGNYEYSAHIQNT